MLVPDATPAFKLFEIKASAVVPVIDKVPASTFILALPVKLTVPLKAFVPNKFRMAPSLLIPFPEIEIGSAANVIPPCTCNAAFVFTVVDPDIAPNAFALCAFNTPL